jgi:hypothetical protein
VPRAESRIWSVAVVGCGIGRAHIAGYRSQPDKFQVLALCDIDEKGLAAVGDEFSIARRTKSIDDVLRMTDIDIVDICTPPALHVAPTLAALAAGKEVVCEKPLAGSLAEIDRIVAAEAQAAGRVMPVLQYRYGNGLQKAKRLIELGIAGKPYLATVETAWRRTAEYYETPWRGRRATELGGVLLTHAIHSHDLLTHLMGPVASVFARTATRVNPVEVEDCAVASLVMHSGALVSLAATLGSHKEISRLPVLRACDVRELADALCSRRRTMADHSHITRSCRSHCRRIGGLPFRVVPLRGPDGGVSRSADYRRRVAGDPCGRPPVTGACHGALSFGRDRRRRRSPYFDRSSALQWLAC